MRTPLRRVALVLASVVVPLLSSGCAALHARSTPAPAANWPATLTQAQSDAAHGDFDGADSLLASFAARYPGSPQTLETAYWRALFKMDPSNRSASLTTAIASLDGYLQDPRPRDHVAEATTLRRAAAQLSELNKLAANAMSQVHDAKVNAANATAAASDAKDAKAAADAATTADAQAEIKRLRDELAKANAELDRIRKRLGQPPPHP